MTPINENILKRFSKPKSAINIHLGNIITDVPIYIDFMEDRINSVLLAGMSGSGKSIFHNHLYMQLEKLSKRQSISYIFIDLTMVDFPGWNLKKQLYPTIYDLEHAMYTLEVIANQLQQQKQPYNDSGKTFIHIEECDMFYAFPERIRLAIETILDNKLNNICLIYSTSRIHPSTIPNWLIEKLAMKVVFRVPSASESQLILGNDHALGLSAPGERIIQTKSSEWLLKPFSKGEVQRIMKWSDDNYHNIHSE